MNVTERPDRMILNVVSGANGEGTLYEDDGDNPDYASKYAVINFAQACEGQTGRYVISSRKGTVGRAPVNRSYQLRIFNTPTPLSATVNGQSATYSYDPNKKCTTVEVPYGSCSVDRTVIVKYSETLSTDIVSAKADKMKIVYERNSKKLKGSFDRTKKKVALEISNSMGKTVLRNTYSNVNSFTEDLTNLFPQLYIGKVVADNQTYVRKFIKN